MQQGHTYRPPHVHPPKRVTIATFVRDPQKVRPNANGSVAWTPSAGQNFECVNEVPGGVGIPASVTLYVRWTNGQPLSGGVYTAVAPDKPVSHTYTFSNGAALGVDNDSPWNGQYLAEISTNWNSSVGSTVSSATVQATSGRIYFEGEGTPANTGQRIFYLAPTTANNGRISVQRQSANMQARFVVDGGASNADVDLGTWPTAPYAVEIIYDRGNATANLRFRARTWLLSGSPGSFVNSSPTVPSGTTDQYTSLSLHQDPDTPTTGPLKINRVIISNDIAEDLSAVSEGEAKGTDYVTATSASLLDSYDVPTYDDPAVTDGFIVRYAVSEVLGVLGVQVRLYEGATLRSTGPTVYAAGEYQWNVPAADVANITDRAAVRVAVYSV